MSVNKVILIGNVGAEPEVRYVEQGVAVAQVRLATSERGYTLANGTQVPERTEWHTVLLWRNLAETVEKYAKCQSKLAAWMEDNIPECFTSFAFPESVRQFIRTNNMEENLNKQIKSRTRLIPAFPNTASLLRLVSAICVEISDDWEAGSYKYMYAIKEL